MEKIRYAKVDLKTDQVLHPRHAEKIRGYIGRIFIDDPNFHNHAHDRFIYKYPLVQYKVVDHKPFLIGLSSGVDSVLRVFQEVNDLDIEQNKPFLFEKSIFARMVDFGPSEGTITYRFKTLWLALNESNYDKYLRMDNWHERKELLVKILVGNLISMSKSLGYTVPAPIEVNLGKLKEVKTSLKGNPMLGFLGTFSVNFEIPDLWGIGKSVSRGFGTVKKVEE